jgi:hypothetical protein
MPENFDTFLLRSRTIEEQNFEKNNRPESSWWGCFSYHDGPPIAGGGIGTFHWHTTRGALFSYINDVLPYLTGSSGNDGIVANVTTAITANMQLGNMSDDEGIERLNHILRHYSQIKWIGTFDQLCHSDDAFCAHVRSWYRQNDPDVDEEDGSNLSAPITPDKIDDFCEAIREYGL